MQKIILTAYKTLYDEAIVQHYGLRQAAVQNLVSGFFTGLQAAAFIRVSHKLSLGVTMLILYSYHDNIRLAEAIP